MSTLSASSSLLTTLRTCYRRCMSLWARHQVKADLVLAFAAHLSFKLAGYVVLVLLARHLDKNELGQLFFVTSLAMLFVLLTELGTNTYLLREVASQPTEGLARCGEVLSLRLALAGVYLLAFNGFLALAYPDLWLVGLLVAPTILLEQLYLSFGGLFFGLRRALYNAISGVVAKLLLVGLLLMVVSSGGDLWAVLLCSLLSSIALIAIAVFLVLRYIGPLRLSWQPAAFRRLLRAAFPFLLTSVLTMLHWNIDLLLLGVFSSYATVAAYGAGFKLLEATRFLTRPVIQIFLPFCTELAMRRDWLALRGLLRTMLCTTGIVGGMIALAVGVAAEPIMLLVFGQRYADSSAVLRVLFLGVPALYVGTASLLLANALGLEAAAARIMLVGVISHVLLATGAILAWGVLGAAWATTLVEGIIAVAATTLIVWKLRERCAATGVAG